MTFEEILKQAKAEWENSYNGKTPLVLVGTASCGRAVGALEVFTALKDEIARCNIEARVIEVGCIGLCSLEPLVTIIKPGELSIVYQKVTTEMVPRLVEGYLLNSDPCLELAAGTLKVDDGQAATIPELEQFDRELRLLLRHCGYINPENVDHYIAQGGYASLNKALAMPRTDIISEVSKSGLRGRGGAGFATGKKWELCRQAKKTPKYVICNADEGDPGAFIDRVLLESDPHQLLEGLIIAGYAVGSEQGFIYVRHEYPLAVSRIKTAISQSRDRGFLGDNILGSGFSFDVTISEGAGAFVSGESTALIRAIEGKRSMPRARPPHSVESGLWEKPTVINNVKTLAYIPLILQHGAAWFSSIGTEGSKGTAVFALAGKIVNTGLTEVPMGTTMHQLVFDVGGGIRNGKLFKAIQIGGPSGGCLPQALLQTPVDFDSLKSAGGMMGSGGLIIMDEDNCMVDIARFFLEFTQKESCGRCSTCRIGTRQLLTILENITTGKADMKQLALLTALAEDVKAGSLCGLGKTAPNPVMTTLRYFRDEYDAHIKEKRCPALVCKNLIAYYIVPDKCERGCEHCVLTCPVKAITSNDKRMKVIDQAKCTKCGSCVEVCPPEYSAVIKVSPISSLPSGEKK